jgi:exopolysaccharide biosynthesis polyprenyl glycosylphosphotransferase
MPGECVDLPYGWYNLSTILLDLPHKDVTTTDMRSNASLLYGVFLVIGDFLAVLAAFGVAYILRVSFDPRPLISNIQAFDYIQAFLAVLPCWILVHGMIGLYSQQIYEKRFVEFGRLLVGSFLGILVVIGYDFISRDAIFPARLVPVYGLGLAFLFLVIFRSLARIIRTELFAFNIGITNLLIVGDTPLSLELTRDLINTRKSGYRILGVVSPRHEAHDQHPGLAVYETFEQAVKAIGLSRIHSIMQTELYVNPNKNNEILTTAQENHISYRFVPGNTELFVGNIEVDLFQSVPVISVHQTALLGWGRIVKRMFDVSLGGALLILTSPVMLLVALAIKLSDGGPVFLRQVRLTRYNHRFRVYKFRSMHVAYNGLSPEEAFTKMGRSDLIEPYRINGNFMPNDPRISAIGKFIRATSLDELPQLFNVLKGDLSLVGPRALIPEELAEYKKRHTILSVKSGLTGLAQVSGRNGLPVDERRKLDVYYVQNWSFWLDLTILIKTIRIVLTREGNDKPVINDTAA